MGVDIGTSTLYSTEWIIDRLRELQPASILDIGCGWGRWGFLAREFLELWEHRFSPDEWRVRIDAIDIHPGTWTPVHPYIYDRTFTEDIRTWELNHWYDVAIACDVLEHMEKMDAYKVLAKLRSRCGAVLIGLPLGAGWERQGFDGNPYEAHLSSWEADDIPGVMERKLTKTEDHLDYGLFQVMWT